jgi:hypothetical protein
MFKTLLNDDYSIVSPLNVEDTRERVKPYLNKGFFDADTYHLKGLFISDTEFKTESHRSIWPIAKCTIKPANEAAIIIVRFYSIIPKLAIWVLLILVISVVLHYIMAIPIILLSIVSLFGNYLKRQNLLFALKEIVNKKINSR